MSSEELIREFIRLYPCRRKDCRVLCKDYMFVRDTIVEKMHQHLSIEGYWATKALNEPWIWNSEWAMRDMPQHYIFTRPKHYKFTRPNSKKYWGLLDSIYIALLKELTTPTERLRDESL